MLTPRQYEAYIAQLIANFLPFKDLEIRRNARLPGVRQPGRYEIDVNVEFVIAAKLRFHLIVECKRWRTPVGREVVQKLAQTRDAIAAHQAVICSPVGYTKEAIEVAEAHGITLWVIAAVRRRKSAVLGDIAVIGSRFPIRHLREDYAEGYARGLARNKFVDPRVEIAVRAELAQRWNLNVVPRVSISAGHLVRYRRAEELPAGRDVEGATGPFPTHFEYVPPTPDRTMDLPADSDLPVDYLGPFLFEQIYKLANSDDVVRTELQQLRSEVEQRIRTADAKQQERWNLEHADKIAGLTPTRRKVLEALRTATQPLGVSQIHVGVDDSSVGAALLGLLSRNYVCEANASEELFTITGTGLAKLAELEEIRVKARLTDQP
jgi:hypothetical protein